MLNWKKEGRGYHLLVRMVKEVKTAIIVISFDTNFF